MKVALITDTHFGARSTVSRLMDTSNDSMTTSFSLPYRNSIDTIVHLGDVFDRRKFINYNTLKSCKEYFSKATHRLV